MGHLEILLYLLKSSAHTLNVNSDVSIFKFTGSDHGIQLT